MPLASAWAIKRPPDFEKPRPVGVDRKRRVAADERVHHARPERRRGVDHRAQVRARRRRPRPDRPPAGWDNSPVPRSRPGGPRAAPGPPRSRPPRGWSTSIWVTPAYRRSDLPGGQHMSSTLENPLAPAKLTSASSVYSGKIAETNPSFMILNSTGPGKCVVRTEAHRRRRPRATPRHARHWR